MNQTVRLEKLLTKLRRKASKAQSDANRFGAAGAMEAFKMSYGEYYAYDKAANWLSEIIK